MAAPHLSADPSRSAPRGLHSARRVIVKMIFLTILPEREPRVMTESAESATTVSATRAKAELAALLRDAEEGRSIIITRHGTPVAGLVPAQDLRRLERLRSAGPEGGLASVAGGWEGSEELVEMTLAEGRRGSRELSSPEAPRGC